MTYNVTLLNKKSFEGKEIMVQAKSAGEAETKALSMQNKGRGCMWAAIIARVAGRDNMAQRFQHKGLRSREDG